MSERGSFVTEFIYCNKCFEIMKKTLCGNHDYIMGKQLEEFPIIAGKVRGSYMGNELDIFRFELFFKHNSPCHAVRMAVIPDSATAVIFTINPDGEMEEA